MFKRLVKYSYATLSLIPAGLTVASAVSYVHSNNDKQSKALLLWAWAGWTALPYSAIMFAFAPYSLLFDSVERKSMDSIQKWWARTTLYPFIKIERTMVCKPPRNDYIVVSNHQSALDVLILLACLDFTTIHFVSKWEVFLIPLVGWVMGLIGHVPLTRGSRESAQTAMDQCVERLSHSTRNWSVLFFAEGTRGLDLKPFKMGAFNLSVQTQKPILPVSIVGSGLAMPRGQELHSLDTSIPIRVTVHDPMEPADNAAELRDVCRARIQSAIG